MASSSAELPVSATTAISGAAAPSLGVLAGPVPTEAVLAEAVLAKAGSAPVPAAKSAMAVRVTASAVRLMSGSAATATTAADLPPDSGFWPRLAALSSAG